MKRSLVLVSGLLCSFMAQANMVLDVTIKIGEQHIQLEGISYSDEIKLWAHQENGLKCAVFAQEEKEDNKVYIALNIIRVNEAGEEVLVASPEIRGDFGQEIIVEIAAAENRSLENSAENVVVKVLARKQALEYQTA